MNYGRVSASEPTSARLNARPCAPKPSAPDCGRHERRRERTAHSEDCPSRPTAACRNESVESGQLFQTSIQRIFVSRSPMRWRPFLLSPNPPTRGRDRAGSASFAGTPLRGRAVAANRCRRSDAAGADVPCGMLRARDECAASKLRLDSMERSSVLRVVRSRAGVRANV